MVQDGQQQLVCQRPPRSSVRKASRKRLTCLSTMSGEKPRTRRAPGSTLGSGKQGCLRTHLMTQQASHPSDIKWACQALTPPDLDISAYPKRGSGATVLCRQGTSAMGLPSIHQSWDIGGDPGCGECLAPGPNWGRAFHNSCAPSPTGGHHSLTLGVVGHRMPGVGIRTPVSPEPGHCPTAGEDSEFPRDWGWCLPQS